MKGHLLYLIGIPGSGKSTIAAALVAGLRRRVRKEPFAHTVYEGGLVQLGREREGRSGTDTLSMSVQSSVLAVLEVGYWNRVLGEGDRLANAAFFHGVEAAGYELVVVLVDTPEEVAAERRAHRGSQQTPSWVKGRITKIENLRSEVTFFIDGTKPVPDNVHLLRTHGVTAAVLR